MYAIYFKRMNILKTQAHYSGVRRWRGYQAKKQDGIE